MGPLDYRTQVLDPIGMALQGYAQRVAQGQAERQMGQQDRALGQADRRLDLSEQQMTFEMERARMADQQAAAARAQQEAAQKAYVDYILSPVKTSDSTAAVIRANPQLAEAVMQVWQGQSEEQRRGLAQFGMQFVYALKSGNVDAAKGLLDRRIQAAEAAGDKAQADAFRAEKMQLDAGQTDVVLSDAMVTLYGGMSPKEFDDFTKSLPGAAADEPESVKALRIRAGEAGMKPGTPEYAQFMVEGGRSSGFAINVDPATGAVSVRQGPGAASAPFTEGQSKDVVYATRARGALEALEPVAGALTGRLERMAEIDPTGFARNLQGDDFQIALNAGNEFLQAILRKDTGAAITEQEQALYGETYLPRPGDNEQLLQQKAAARRRAIAAIEAGMSPAQMVAQERALMAEGATVDPLRSARQKLEAAAKAKGSKLTLEEIKGSLTEEEYQAVISSKRAP
jgi:hypothetical protein